MDHERCRGLLHTFFLGVVTAVLATIAGAQAIMFFWQLRLMREGVGVDDAKTAANAAMAASNATALHATAVVRAEMPVIRLHELQVRRRDGELIIGGPLPQHFTVPIMLINHGRTPAFPIDFT